MSALTSNSHSVIEPGAEEQGPELSLAERVAAFRLEYAALCAKYGLQIVAQIENEQLGPVLQLRPSLGINVVGTNEVVG